MTEHKVGTPEEWLAARYSAYAPQSDFLVFSNQLLDRAPKGREYEDAADGASTPR